MGGQRLLKTAATLDFLEQPIQNEQDFKRLQSKEQDAGYPKVDLAVAAQITQRRQAALYDLTRQEASFNALERVCISDQHNAKELPTATFKEHWPFPKTVLFEGQAKAG